MKKYLLFMVGVIVLCSAAAVWAAASRSSMPDTPETAAEKAFDTHPAEMGDNDCLYCHEQNSMSEMKSESPAGGQWAASMHGLNNVGCTTCHGDEGNFRAASSIDNCISCHPGETSVIKRKTEAKEGRIICVNCHEAHDFTVKKEKKSVHAE